MLLSLAPSCLGAEASDKKAPSYPKEQRRTYIDTYKSKRVYLVQEPKTIPDNPTILIYMHGSAGKEEQGMHPTWAYHTFTRLRNLMHKWQWVYVCPRDKVYKGLLTDLKKRYKPAQIILAGASAGGNVVLREACRNPEAYAGLLLMCPAIGYFNETVSKKMESLSMPIWIVSGEKDRMINKFCHSMVKKLKEMKLHHHFREIAGGNHGSPVEEVRWKEALEFLTKKISDVKTPPRLP